MSKALPNETVAFRAIETKLLVRFRHTYIREIDLSRNESYALLADVAEPPVQTAAGVENKKDCFPHLLESNDTQFAQAHIDNS